MSKIKIFMGVVLGSFLFGTTFAAYQQQGFTTFQENGPSIAFSCDKQCFILLGGLGSNQIISLEGTLEGAGQVGYGFLVGDKIYPGETILANGNITQKFLFSNAQVFSQIPKEQTQIVFLVNGAVQTAGITLDFGKLFFSEKIAFAWKDFRTNEPLRPYSINLRYGVKLLGTPLLQYFYWIFVIGLCYCIVFIVSKEKRRFSIIIFSTLLLLVFSLRNLRNWTDWTMSGMSTYTTPPEAQKIFFDLGDYPVFIAKMREKLDLDDQFGKTSCTLFFDAFQEWPFKVHADTVYIKPCEPATVKTSADYIVFYKKPIDTALSSKEVLLDRNGSFLIRNK